MKKPKKQIKQERDYDVSWIIQVTAKNPKEAAKLSLDWITNGDAKVFSVKNSRGRTVLIDLAQ